MKIEIKNSGLTLLELLTAMALILIMVSMVLVATQVSWVDTNKKLTESTMALLDSALEDYREYNPYSGSTNPLLFPEPNALALSGVVFPADQVQDQVQVGKTGHSASLYAGLNLVPDAKKILEKIADSQITLIEAAGGSKYPVFIDAWKTPLDYRYVDGMTFPVIISAGPDKKFNTTDDITNR
jgi:prepilin-type N-terminal cleavage/methylation domain-containing protein